MKAVVTKFSLILTILISATASAAEGWFDSIEAAVEEAKKSDKPIMVKFTGSDWCAPCQAIQKKVFSKPEFMEQVKDKFVLCIIDSPKADKALAEKNKSVIQKHGIRGFPTVLLLDSEGKEFSRYNPGGFDTVEKMMEQLSYQLRRKVMF